MPRKSKGFTLIEVLVVAAIIAVLVGVASLSWKTLTASGLDAQAVNTLAKHAAVARSYALQYRIETILAIEPPTNPSSKPRMRLFVHNPPIHGGTWTHRVWNEDLRQWEHMPGIVGIRVTRHDKDATEFYYVPVLGDTAVLPADLAVAPVASAGITTTPNTTWTALCFDGNGKLFRRSKARLVRHDASGTFTDFDGNAYTAAFVALTTRGAKFYKPSVLLATLNKNRLDEISSREFEAFLATTDPPDLWQAVVLNQFSGRPLAME